MTISGIAGRLWRGSWDVKGFDIGGKGVCLLQLSGLYPILVQDVPSHAGILIDFFQHHIAEGECLFSGKLRGALLLVREIAGKRGSLAADGDSPTLKVGEFIRDSGDVT